MLLSIKQWLYWKRTHHELMKFSKYGIVAQFKAHWMGTCAKLELPKSLKVIKVSVPPYHVFVQRCFDLLPELEELAITMSYKADYGYQTSTILCSSMAKSIRHFAVGSRMDTIIPLDCPLPSSLVHSDCSRVDFNGKSIQTLRFPPNMKYFQAASSSFVTTLSSPIFLNVSNSSTLIRI